MFHGGGGHSEAGPVLCWALPGGSHEVVSPLIMQDGVWQVEAVCFPDVLAQVNLQLGQWDVAHDWFKTGCHKLDSVFCSTRLLFRATFRRTRWTKDTILW